MLARVQQQRFLVVEDRTNRQVIVRLQGNSVET